MTHEVAFKFLMNEFVDRFRCTAEGCCDKEDTHEALKALAPAGVDSVTCAGCHEVLPVAEKR